MYITANVPMIENGSARLGMTVAQTFRRNTKITMMTSAERQRHGELHVAVRLANRVRAVVEHVHVDARRQLGAELRQQRLDGVGDRDRVGARLALDAERDRALLRRRACRTTTRCADPRRRR